MCQKSDEIVDLLLIYLIFFSKKRGRLVDFFDLTLLKDLVYVNVIIGMASGLFSDNIFSSLLPMYLKYLGFSRVSFR